MLTGYAIAATLFANFLFAFWYQSLKHLRGYPLPAFMLWLYLSSSATVGIAVLLRGHLDMPDGIAAELSGKWGLAVGVAFGGFIMTLGLILTLLHMQEHGIVSNQAIAGTANSIIGLFFTFWLGGLPDTISWELVIFSAMILLVASAVCQYSNIINLKRNNDDTGTDHSPQPKKQSLLYQNIIVVTSMALMTGYIISFTLGTRSPSRPNGFPPLLCVTLLCTGSLVCAVIYAAWSLTKTHSWKKAFSRSGKTPIMLAVGSGICHYGGNLLLIYALPVVSAPVSYLLSKTSNIWGYLWGLWYGEYKKAGWLAKLYLAAGIGLYILGTILLTYALYN